MTHFLNFFAIIKEVVVNILLCTCLDTSPDMSLGKITRSEIPKYKKSKFQSMLPALGDLLGQGQLLRSLRVGRCGIRMQVLQFSFAMGAFPVGTQTVSAIMSCLPVLTQGSSKIRCCTLYIIVLQSLCPGSSGLSG